MPRPATADTMPWPGAEIRAVPRPGIENAVPRLQYPTALKGVKIYALVHMQAPRPVPTASLLAQMVPEA